jgi:hypothetical protein
MSGFGDSDVWSNGKPVCNDAMSGTSAHGGCVDGFET